ncbi:hypothetical protein CSPAE12_02705 [Colletotrichum incanum]|nr:hypothetical protein CSPAE12_02705 [Colletotrichum incanum]
MLPPRRELPFSLGKQAEPTAPKRPREQPELSGLGWSSTKASREEEVFQQPTPQTISKPVLSAEQAKKSQQTRLLVFERKDNNIIDNPVTKKKKPDSSPKPISTSPIPLPIIPSAPFKRKVIVRRPDVPSNPYYPLPNRTVQNVGDKIRSRGLVATPSSNATSSVEAASARELGVAGATELLATDTSSTSSEEEVDLDSTPAMPKPAKTSVIADGNNVLPKPTSTKMDQGTQTLNDLSDPSAKDDDLFVAKFQLMWDIRSLQQACFQRLLTDSRTQQHIDETKVFKELEQNTVDICQAAIDRYGLAMGDIPYEKLLNAIMQPRYEDNVMR